MGQSVVVLGAQWGDEGKGKIVDLLTEEIGAVVRFQGGHNAGHTLVINGKTYKLADFKGKSAVVVAWFPKAFTQGCTIECQSLAEKGVSPSVVDDQVGRLTFTDELVRATRHLLDSDAARCSP